MNIKLNGKDHTLEKTLNVDELLAAINLAGKPVVVELNQKALFPREYADTACCRKSEHEAVED